MTSMKLKPYKDGILWIIGNGRVAHFDRERMALLHKAAHDLEATKSEQEFKAFADSISDMRKQYRLCPFDMVANELRDILKEPNKKREIQHLIARLDLWKKELKCGSCQYCDRAKQERKMIYDY